MACGALARFLEPVRAGPFRPRGLRARLHGSLAFTGVGHATVRAVILGLAGFRPDDYDADAAEAALARNRAPAAIACRRPGGPCLRGIGQAAQATATQVASSPRQAHEAGKQSRPAPT